MRAFVKLREVLATHKELSSKIEQMAATQKDHAALFSIVIKDIQTWRQECEEGTQNLRSPRRQRSRIGFVIDRT